MRWVAGGEKRRERDGVARGVGKGEIGGLLADLGGLRGGGQAFAERKCDQAEEYEGGDAQGAQNGAGDLAAVKIGLGESPAKSDEEQEQAEGEEQKIGPWHVAGDRISGEDGNVAQEGEDNDEEAEPEWRVWAALGGVRGCAGICGARVGGEIVRHAVGPYLWIWHSAVMSSPCAMAKVTQTRPQRRPGFCQRSKKRRDKEKRIAAQTPGGLLPPSPPVLHKCSFYR